MRFFLEKDEADSFAAVVEAVLPSSRPSFLFVEGREESSRRKVEPAAGRSYTGPIDEASDGSPADSDADSCTGHLDSDVRSKGRDGDRGSDERSWDRTL